MRRRKSEPSLASTDVQRVISWNLPRTRHLIGIADLPAELRGFWAKSGGRASGLWLPVAQHLMDAADIAGRLFDEMIAAPTRARMAVPWRGDEDMARRALRFLAGTHDIGKVTPGFQSQVDDLADVLRSKGWVIPSRDFLKEERQKLTHGLAGQIALEDFLQRCGYANTCGTGTLVLTDFLLPVGAHHGRYPSDKDVAAATKVYRYGVGNASAAPWVAAREELIRWMADRVGFPLNGAEQPLLPELTVDVAGLYCSLVVVADWLASNELYFPLFDRGDDGSSLTAQDQEERVARAMELANFPGPVHFRGPLHSATASYARAFRDEGAPFLPTPMQKAVWEIARQDDPDFLVIEAQPGSGKTEAALIAVESLVRSRGLQGVFIALPTRATTDAMFTRVKSWLERETEHSNEWVTLHLAHGQNDLNEDFAALLARGGSLEIHEPGHGVQANAWMLGRWRSTLAPVVVGTIDHVLLAALKSRHVLLRQLGLAGKVVVLDEVHAADAYMESYVEAALTWLGMYGAPVVLLSATLPEERRRALLRAYVSGRDHRRIAEVEPDILEVSAQQDYPRLTVLPSGAVRAKEVAPSAEDHRGHVPATIRPMEVRDEHHLARTVRDMVSDGGCVAIVRNTVDAAQRTYAALRALMPTDELLLVHARFLAADRAENDRRLLRLFGRDGRERPRRMIVVATQVVEQSLDIDFDALITDPAPMDLVLQRLGRVHRHVRSRRPECFRDPVAHVLITDASSAPWAYHRGSDLYGEYRNLRTLAVLVDEPEGVRVETVRDIARLTHLAYGESPIGPPSWQEAMRLAEEQWRTAQNKAVANSHDWQLADEALPTWTASALHERFKGDAPDGETDASFISHSGVRDGTEQIPVLVIPIDEGLGGQAVHLPWSERAGCTFDTSCPPDADLLRCIRSWRLNIPPGPFRPMPGSGGDLVGFLAEGIWELTRACHWKLLDHPLLKGELVLPMHVDDHDPSRLTQELRGKRLVYTREKGLEVVP